MLDDVSLSCLMDVWYRLATPLFSTYQWIVQHATNSLDRPAMSYCLAGPYKMSLIQ